MLDILKFCVETGWNLFGTLVIILAIGYVARNIFEGITEVIIAKIKK